MIFPDFHSVQIMAIVNITDNSFYSASRTMTIEAIESRIAQVVAEGATIIDIGGCSSRPGSQAVPLETEWERVDLGVGAARRVAPHIAVSVDTFRAEIVRRVVEKYGDVIVNDITAGQGDGDMFETVAKAGLPYIAMHMRGTSDSMQSMTDYQDVAAEVIDYLLARAAEAEKYGIARENIILDPGFGFAKSVEQNYTLLASLGWICRAGYAVLAGLSRKSMIYKVTGSTPERSLAGTVALNWEALRQGATILRVHDVAEAVQIADIFRIYSNDKGYRHL